MEIIADYNSRFKVSYSINEFDLYYQDVQARIKTRNSATKIIPGRTRLILQ